jgi:hypothetical protein
MDRLHHVGIVFKNAPDLQFSSFRIGAPAFAA